MMDERGGRVARLEPRQRRAVGIAIAVLVAVGLFTLKGFLSALIWALVFAIALWPLRARLRARLSERRRRWIPVGLVAGVLFVFVVPVVIVSIPLALEARSASDWVKQAREKGVPPPPALARLSDGQAMTQAWQRNLGRPGGISELASRTAHGSLAEVGRTAAEQAAHRLVLVGFMLLALFFLLRDGNEVVAEIRTVSRRLFGAAGEDVGEQAVRSVRGTVNGLVLVGLGEGVVLSVAYVIAGVPHPTLLGLVAALLAMVPFGAAAAILFASATLLVSGGAVAAAVVLAFGLVVTFCADHFVRSLLNGGSTKLPFLWVLLGILGGVEAWGLVGLYAGPAIMAALVLVWQEAAASVRDRSRR